MGTTTVTAEPGNQLITVTRDFDAPVDVVFRAWTDPDLLKQWLGPRRLTTEIDRYELRAGGSWRYLQREADGREYAFHGVFHNDPSPDGFVQTFEFEGAPGHVSLDTLRLEALPDGRTRAHMNSVFQSVEARDGMIAAGMEGGMNEGFDRLDELLASQAAAAGATSGG